MKTLKYKIFDYIHIMAHPSLAVYVGLKDSHGVDIRTGDKIQYGEDSYDINFGIVKYYGDEGYPAFDIDNKDCGYLKNTKLQGNALSYFKHSGYLKVIIEAN